MHINTKKLQKTNKSGFTIVELLIVIVVIGILAAISIVAYSNIQDRARYNSRYSDAKAIMKFVEMYRTESANGLPPQYPSGGNMSAVEAAIVPQYTSSLPSDPKYPYRYAGIGANYAILIYNEDLGGSCKVSSNPASTASWWSSAPECPKP